MQIPQVPRILFWMHPQTHLRLSPVRTLQRSRIFTLPNVNQHTWLGSVLHYRALHSCYDQSFFQNTLAFVFMRLHSWIILVPRRLVQCLPWPGDSEPLFLFPRRVLEHLAVECSQEGAWEIAHIAKHKRDHDASAQGWELSLWGRLLDSGLHPGKKVIYLTRAMTGNQDSLSELSPLIVSLERHDPTCVLFF